MNIKKVVIIGSGTMGSGIAAHLCNANVPVTLLDLKTEISLLLSILLKKDNAVNEKQINETSDNIEPLTKAAS